MFSTAQHQTMISNLRAIPWIFLCHRCYQVSALFFIIIASTGLRLAFAEQPFVDTANLPPCQFSFKVTDYGVDLDKLRQQKLQRQDLLPPIAGKNGILELKIIPESKKVQIQWTQARDNRSQEQNLAYQIILNQNPSNLQPDNRDMLIKDSDWQQNISSAEIMDVQPDRPYFVNLAVQDEAGNIAFYNMQSFTIPGSAAWPVEFLSPNLERPIRPQWKWLSGFPSTINNSNPQFRGTYRLALNDHDLETSQRVVVTRQQQYQPSEILNDGSHFLCVQEQLDTDQWSPIRCQVLTIDTMAPQLPQLLHQDFYNQKRPVFFFIFPSEMPDAMQLRVNDGIQIETNNPANGIQWPYDLDNGHHRLVFRVADTARNWSDWHHQDFIIDSQPPNPPTISGLSMTRERQPYWTWRGIDKTGSALFRYSFRRITTGESATETRALGCRMDKPLADGVYTIYVQERDLAGNWSGQSKFTTAIDNAAPQPGDDGSIRFVYRDKKAISLSWQPAQDAISSQDNLKYLVLRSNQDDLENSDPARDNDKVAHNWQKRSTQFHDYDLEIESEYHYSVLVSDPLANQSRYARASAWTLPHNWIWLLHGSYGPPGTHYTQTLLPGLNLSLSAYYRLFYWGPWLFSLAADLEFGRHQANTDNGLDFRIASLAGGVSLGYLLPWYRHLSLHINAIAGAARTKIIDSMQIADDTSVDPNWGLQAQLRYRFFRSYLFSIQFNSYHVLYLNRAFDTSYIGAGVGKMY